ncbi:DMT family transporter [Tropicimonas sediminicola]|uniref:Threonine/homoserine efflux transporter RhtA n=1 Tax=Tropicimonas sediminicola TaxID=1031541 RepID=A0A239CHT7_9RHOB|nr:DMT family transporter [Tropicimonas sediminicola]SNS19248.1 Threonine/homoserine efflux transporter RhtA [Tropicimonas sediminicola]
MQLFLLVVLTMVAFAANSILNRLALADGLIGALPFAALRLASGAAVLCALVMLQRKTVPLRSPGRWIGVASLTLYMTGFSVAYVGIEAGVGALILFGGVQVTMFGGAILAGKTIPPAQWLGAALAFGGLCWLLWPSGGAAPSTVHAALMLAAALGWGIYSLAGAKAGAPLPATAANFALATPIALALMLAAPLFEAGGDPAAELTAAGVGLAVVSGVVTSGLGYALWYMLLPRLAPTVAALAQLSVPVIAMAGGMLFLGETLTLRFVLAATLVLGGIAVGVLVPRRAAQRTSRSSGS